MGKVLAMTPKLFVAALLCLASCASVPGAAQFAGSLTGQTPARPAATLSADAPEITVLMRQRGVQFRMFLIETDGADQVWAAKDGAQIALTDGVLTATRGFGADLMSAEAPTRAALTDAQPDHPRLRYFLSGEGQTRRIAFACSVTHGEGSAASKGREVVETCTSEIGTTRNQYWLGPDNRLLKSREWVSHGVGYIEISRE